MKRKVSLQKALQSCHLCGQFVGDMRKDHHCEQMDLFKKEPSLDIMTLDEMEEVRTKAIKEIN